MKKRTIFCRLSYKLTFPFNQVAMVLSHRWGKTFGRLHHEGYLHRTIGEIDGRVAVNEFDLDHWADYADNVVLVSVVGELHNFRAIFDILPVCVGVVDGHCSVKMRQRGGVSHTAY